MKTERVIYYADELNEEFSKAQIKAKAIDGDYRYLRPSLWGRLAHLLWYRVVFTPIAVLHSRVIHGHRTVGREKLKPFRGKGYFMYGNHTQAVGDAFIPNVLDLQQDHYVIVHPNNVSMPLLGRITPHLGALPLPDDMEAYRNFISAVEQRVSEGNAVVIYPEAHIWPYYTGVRPFGDGSFGYPVKLGVPVFCFTNTYQPRRCFKRPRIVTYIDGPFYPDEALPARRRRAQLRDEIYECMRDRASLSSVEWIKYVRRESI